MAELKTQKTTESAEAFLSTIEPEGKRKDSFTLLEIFKEASGKEPVMWGTSIVGFGQYHYKSERSTQEGDWPLVAFSPRQQNLTLYFMSGFDTFLADQLAKLGKHKTSKSCLYINRLPDVDPAVLEETVRKGFNEAKQKLS